MESLVLIATDASAVAAGVYGRWVKLNVFLFFFWIESFLKIEEFWGVSTPNKLRFES